VQRTPQRGLIIVLIPLAYGLIVNRLMLLIPPLLSQLVFGAFWFWAGVFFAQMGAGKLRGFLLGNSLWALSFGLFTWQFILTGAEDRVIGIAVHAQHYMASFLWLGTRIYRLFDSTIHGTNIMLTAYASMLVVFTIGFIWGSVRQ